MSSTDPFNGVPLPLRSALEQRGFSSLTPVQEAVLAADAQHHDLRISSQTGSGKTVALGLALAGSLLAEAEAPAATETEFETETDDDAAPPRRRPLGSEVAALVIAPTRELAVQVRDELRWLLHALPWGRVDAVTGGTDVRAEQRMLRRPPTILVGTPGRLLDHLRSGALRCDAVRHVVLDEADRMLDMGFRDELDAIIDALPKQRRSHLVSATFADGVKRVADRFQHDPLHLQGTALGQANDDIEHVAQLVAPTQRYAALVNALLMAPSERVLVFVERRSEATELSDMLAVDGFAALPLSGELNQAQRTRTLHAFRTGTIQVLVATDVAARGIDVPDISLVVHMSPPQAADDYTHRAGRTGRAGQQGRSVMLVPPRSQRFVTRLLADAGIEAQWRAAPTPAKVRKAITKATRRQLHARLDADAPVGESTLAYAQQLLGERDPAAVVAALLEMAAPRLPREPMELQAIEPRRLEELPVSARPAREEGRRPWARGPRPSRGGGAGRPRRDRDRDRDHDRELPRR